jgi:hypothetical protein
LSPSHSKPRFSTQSQSTTGLLYVGADRHRLAATLLEKLVAASEVTLGTIEFALVGLLDTVWRRWYRRIPAGGRIVGGIAARLFIG